MSQKSKPSTIQEHPSVLPGIDGSCNSLKHVLDLSCGPHLAEDHLIYVTAEAPSFHLSHVNYLTYIFPGRLKIVIPMEDPVWSSFSKRRARTQLQRQCLGGPPNVAEEVLKLNSVKKNKCKLS